MRQDERVEFADYEELVVCYEAGRRIVWVRLNSSPRPCFTVRLLRELRDVQLRVLERSSCADGPRYFVLASAYADTFNLGGDLDLFERLIRGRDRASLQAYADLCIDCVYGLHRELRTAGVTTVALVQGRALGGGFEAALACNVLIAERRAKLGLPEIKFNLFPGMGAASFLQRRIGAARTEQLLVDGRPLPASSLAELGLIDGVAEDGAGEEAVYGYVRRAMDRQVGLDAIWRVMDQLQGVPRSELERVVHFWVDRAMESGEAALQTMRRLVNAQSRLTTETLKECAVPLVLRHAELGTPS